ncbi:MAG: MFS transporter [Alphaproteobacteria bacterium]
MVTTGVTARAANLGAVIRAMSALLLGIAILNLGSGALMAIIGVRLSVGGESNLVIGAIASAYFFGLLAGALFGARVIDRVGHIRAFAVYAAADAISILLLVTVEGLVAWVALRWIAGYCMAGLSMIAESWLNHRATNVTRGRVLSLYVIVMNGAFAFGPLLLNFGDPAGAGLLVIAGILFVASLLPVALTRTGNPEIGEQARLSLRRLFALSPLGVLGALTIGLVESAIFGLGPVYGAAVGLDASRISLFLAVTLGGVLVMQYPLGAISDRFDREKVILAVAATAGLAAALIAFVEGPGFWLLLALGFVTGGLASPLYPLSVAETNDWLEADELVPASAGIVLAYSLGASAGPMAASVAMEGLGAGGLFAFIAVVLFALAAYALIRVIKGLTKPADEQTAFWPASWISPVAAGLDPRAPAEPDYDDTAAEYDGTDDETGA